MRRRPQEVPPPDRRGAPPVPPIQRPIVSSDPQVIDPFLVSGGESSFQYAAGPPLFFPHPDGVQLITSIYVPRGRVAFLKQIRVAPFMPTVFSDPWHGWERFWRVFRNFGGDDGPTRPGGQFGVYETPFGWESYFDAGAEPVVYTYWYWHLRILKGRIEDIKNVQNIPAFNIANAASWYLADQIAVPRSAYGQSIPGRAVFPRQKIQVLQADQLSLHVPVTEGNTLCLFAEWTQSTTDAIGRNDVGHDTYSDDEEFPLLPSWGQMLGYMQPIDREASLENALHGWGG